MLSTQAEDRTTTVSKAPKCDKVDDQPLKQYLTSIKNTISKQSPTTRANLSGRFRVN